MWWASTINVWTYVYLPSFEIICFFVSVEWLVLMESCYSNTKPNVLIWGMAQWNISVWDSDLTPDLYSIFTLSIHFFLCTLLVFHEAYEITILSCPIFSLFVSLFFHLIVLRFPRKHLLSLEPSQCLLQNLIWSRIFLIKAVSQKFDMWGILKHFRKTHSGENKDHFLSGFTYPDFQCVPESSSKHSRSVFCK